MKNTNHLLLCFLALLITISCEDKLESDRPESVHKAVVINFLTELTQDNSEENTEKINTLMTNINFHQIDQRKLNERQDILIADLKGETAIGEAGVVKVVFLASDKKIVSGNLITFETTGAPDINALISDIVTSKPHSFDGTTRVYNLYEKLIFFNTYNKGVITSNGRVRSKDIAKGAEGSRTEGCIDWYLITTVHYVGGGSSTSSEYLYTTCDCVSYTTRTSNTQCGGGDGGGGSSSGTTGTFPSNPQHGDRVFFANPDGSVAIYECHISDDRIVWEIMAITLPEAIVTAAGPYYFLPDYPYHQQIVFGPDGLIYQYDAGWSQWQGYRYDFNEVKRKFATEFINKYRNPFMFIPYSDFTVQEVLNQAIAKLINLNVADRFLYDSELHYNMKPLYAEFVLPDGSVQRVDIVSPGEWTTDFYFPNPDKLTSPTDSEPISITTNDGPILLTIYFQKTANS